MEYIEKIKKMLCRELEKFSMKAELNVTDLEKIHKLSDTIKNLDKIKMLEEESEGYSEARMGRGGSRYSYDDEMMYSERRGRGRNAKRDSMGRYSSEGGYAEDYRGGMYSYDDAKDHLMSKIGEAMESADPNEREILKDCMRKLERI
jgi:hypothetical protein